MRRAEGPTKATRGAQMDESVSRIAANGQQMAGIRTEGGRYYVSGEVARWACSDATILTG